MTIWQKKDKYFCRVCNRPFDTMVEAIEGMENLQDMVIYDMFCDGVGVFCVCPYDDIIKQTHPKGIDCIFRKPENRRKRNSIKEELQSSIEMEVFALNYSQQNVLYNLTNYDLNALHIKLA